jgi:NAD(P)-dependent dehydrogenase (short-subunit alcohol dehydrogenase family)
MRLKHKTVLITGASKGIGSALALGMAKEGANLILNYHTDRKGAQAVAEQIRRLGRNALIVNADIAKVTQVQRMFQTARKSFARLDVLVNNAGVTGWTSLFQVTEKKWDLVIDTNLKGTFFCSVEAAKWMRECGEGNIINVSTNCAALGVKNLVAYATSKGGIHAMTKQLAVELAPFKIRVNTFAPGPVNVERNLQDDPGFKKAWGSMVPLGRTAEPEEMVGTAVFLASEDSSYMTGQIFYVDGGWTVSGKVPVQNMNKAMARNK